MFFARNILVCCFLVTLLAAAVLDWKRNTIGNRFSVMIFLLGTAAIWIFPEIPVCNRLLGTVVISVPMLLISVFVPGAFGGGDIKLMAAGGWLLGWKANVFAGATGLVAAGIFCVILLMMGKITRHEKIALGPFLAFGLAVAVFVY